MQGAYAQRNDTCGMKHKMNRIKGGKSDDSPVKQGIRHTDRQTMTSSNTGGRKEPSKDTSERQTTATIE